MTLIILLVVFIFMLSGAFFLFRLDGKEKWRYNKRVRRGEPASPMMSLKGITASLPIPIVFMIDIRTHKIPHT